MNRFVPRDRRRSLGLWALLALAAILTIPSRPIPAAESAAAVTAADQRLADVTKYLSSDELEGRGIETKGLDLAADYIAKQFADLGLKTKLFDDTPFQRFSITTGASLGEKNELEFTGPTTDGDSTETVKQNVGKEFTPLAVGGAGKFDLPLVFVGYGITAKNEGYDDYAGVDVKDRAVIILRHEPEQNNPHSVFNGQQPSEYAAFRRKVSNAYEHGARAVIFVSDKVDLRKSIVQLRSRWQAAVDALAEANAKFKTLKAPDDDLWRQQQERLDKLADEVKSYAKELRDADDPLLAFDGAGLTGEARDFPVLWVRRRPIDRMIKQALGTTLEQLEIEIDKGPTPHSRVLEGWTARGDINIDRKETEIKNVAAVLEGTGPHRDETIVIGAHYDHLGHGEPGSADPGSHEIHNGADDNASGVAVLIEVARRLSERSDKLGRKIVFLAFTGEERGLLGSARYVRDPLVPLDKTVAMINMDMVGRLTDNKLIVYGTDTAAELEGLVQRLAKPLDFEILAKHGGFGPSDHSSFYARQIPVLHFFTGSHPDYHRPTDDFPKLNVDGMRRVGLLVADVAAALADAPDPPHFQESKEKPAGGGGDRPYFGSIPDFSSGESGYALAGITPGSPAERAGIKPKDVIIRLGESRIGNLEDFDSALRKHKAGDKVPVVVKRGKEEVKLTVTLDPPR
ncbi:MAG TPA: M28 family peptidase [Pirellulales bacterium]|jgi:hypothetical protein|nr:M28 family peptidase [Pirellulales bacterium]